MISCLKQYYIYVLITFVQGIFWELSNTALKVTPPLACRNTPMPITFDSCFFPRVILIVHLILTCRLTFEVASCSCPTVDFLPQGVHPLKYPHCIQASMLLLITNPSDHDPASPTIPAQDSCILSLLWMIVGHPLWHLEQLISM